MGLGLPEGLGRGYEEYQGMDEKLSRKSDMKEETEGRSELCAVSCYMYLLATHLP